MGRKRKPNLEVEYELEREVKDLKQEIAKLKKMLRNLEKADKVEKVDEEEKIIIKVKVPQVKECPRCGAPLKISDLPFGKLEICETGCGHRSVIKK